MVLVVEDDVPTRAAVEELLRSRGYETLCAGDGVDALMLIREHGAPDGIVLDLLLPEMNGELFLDEIRKDEDLREVPVIVLSAVSNPHLRQHTQGVLRKPGDMDLLLDLLEAQLQQKAR